tara:strand:- start:3568 stop:4362 length:795 start_codon:yes stop_codon:yes gene_type:complete
MPVYNSSKYVKYAIESVLNQSYHNWELIIINDGSTDQSENIILSYDDLRIKYYVQNNLGVSAARNLALKYMKGLFFCFLDSDDVLPSNSLQSRINIFNQNPDISFVDGVVLIKDYKMDTILRYFRPSFKGNPYNKLIQISERCFFGPSWMIKRNSDIKYIFNPNMTHLEDLYFYLSISENGIYDYTNDPILYYRTTSTSSMSNLSGLEGGYYKYFNLVKNFHKYDYSTILYLKYKICRIMFSIYIFDKNNPKKAFSILMKYLFM